MEKRVWPFNIEREKHLQRLAHVDERACITRVRAPAVEKKQVEGSKDDHHDDDCQHNGASHVGRARLALPRLLQARVANIAHHAHWPAVSRSTRRGSNGQRRFPHNDALYREVVKLAQLRVVL